MQRTNTTIVTFKYPFKLGNEDEAYPAGTYSIETDEELLQDVSFPAYRRTATTMQRISDDAPAYLMPVETINPLHLEAAILLDKTR